MMVLILAKQVVDSYTSWHKEWNRLGCKYEVGIDGNLELCD